MFGVRFQSDYAAASGKRSREPNRAVTAERANLQDLAGLAGSCQKMKEHSLGRGDLNRRQTCSGGGQEGSLQRGIRRMQQIGDVLINGRPNFLSHGFPY